MEKPVAIKGECEDGALIVDLFLNGNIWQEGFQLPIHYTQTIGDSKVDIVQAVRDALPTIATNAVIHIAGRDKKSPKPKVWQWSSASVKGREIVNCFNISGRNRTLWNAINIVPLAIKPVGVVVMAIKKPAVINRPRSSANNFLPLLVKEPWRSDEPTGRYPKKWWTLEVTGSDGKRVRNPRLPKDLVLPTYKLPQLGAANFFWEHATALEDYSNGGNFGPVRELHLTAYDDKARSILRVSPDSLTNEERPKVDALLKLIDNDYISLKQGLAKNAIVSSWFQKGFDILPDLERGGYMWVYTGVPKKTAAELISPYDSMFMSTNTMMMPLGQQIDNDDLPLCKEKCRETELTVDIFYDGKLIRENEAMPLDYWHRNGGGDTMYTDLIIEAKEWLCLNQKGRVNSIAVYTNEVKTKKVIIWEEQTFTAHHLVSCEDVCALKDQYVAIGLSSSANPIHYECAMCEMDALFGNEKLEAMFCCKKCEDTFRESM